MSESQEEPLSIYCPACNESFVRVQADTLCPQCGMPISAGDNSYLKTMLWKSAEEWMSRSEALQDAKDRRIEALIGKTLEKYFLQSLLGRGGMGWVFLGRHLQLNRSCAVKVLSPDLVSRDPDYLDRFCTEGQAAASIVHPNVVTVHAIGQTDDLNFLEMEYVPGKSLQTEIRNGPLLIPRATFLALGIANGLAAAHRLGIVHRDLKPDNVLLTHHGIPKISDFGLAKRLHGNSYFEMPGTLAGTPHFMAPELFSGVEASPASDVYALGVCFYYMLAGKLPFPRRKMQDLVSAATTETAPNIREHRPELPLELCECLGLMMEKSPQNRPRDGIEASQLLQAVLGQTRDLESLMHEAFDHTRHVSWVRRGEQYQIDVSLPDERKQTVFVTHSNHRYHERLLQIYSVCCPAEPHYFSAALRLNSRISHGALALRDVDDQEYFVITCSYPRSTVDGEEIQKSVLEIASHADAVELLLTGKDVN
ncbi:protein kinase [Thalassoglobus sp. JC818]|uniref:serine/threonine protein kinase n=1 Tax=Thalassoglobus sp. JC818 TaxID=3232136 RepID=UPI0034574E25